jgi:SlyX protein
MKTLEERLIDLESRLTFQEDLIDTLNTTVFRQQQQIDELELLCTRLAQLCKWRIRQHCGRRSLMNARRITD